MGSPKVEKLVLGYRLEGEHFTDITASRYLGEGQEPEPLQHLADPSSSVSQPELLQMLVQAIKDYSPSVVWVRINGGDMLSLSKHTVDRICDGTVTAADFAVEP